METDDHQRNLNTKYQKLAAEYAKVRSQVQVLKKAVVEEQQQSTALKEQLTSQDQCLRKLEQELDSVKFRNRQLEKRIEILQQPDNSGASSSSLPSLPTSQVDSNLLVHVEQNKQLQESLALLNEKYSVEVGRLKRMIDNEMVPRELLDSIKTEHSEKLALLNKALKELAHQNSELLDRVNSYELEERSAAAAAASSGNNLLEELDPSSAGQAELVQKLTESEMDRERLTSEVQILKLKLNRYMGLDDGGSSSAAVRSPEVQSPVVETTTTTTIIGRCDVVVGLEEERHNQLAVGVLRSRNNELVRLLQVSDSKAVYYYHEAFNLCRLVRTNQLSYKRLDAEFSKLKVKYRGVCDELEDIKSGYEQQVNSLTEHIAILNEKLARMVEELGFAKHHHQSSGGGGKR